MVFRCCIVCGCCLVFWRRLIPVLTPLYVSLCPQLEPPPPLRVNKLTIVPLHFPGDEAMMKHHKHKHKKADKHKKKKKKKKRRDTSDEEDGDSDGGSDPDYAA